MGSTVRESVDALRAAQGTAHVADLPWILYVHRTFSLLLLALSFLLVRWTDGLAGLRARAGLLTGIALAETGLGALLYYLELPVSLQPLHLLFSAFLFVVAVDAAVKAYLQVRPVKEH
jgi:heme A synthase